MQMALGQALHGSLNAFSAPRTQLHTGPGPAVSGAAQKCRFGAPLRRPRIRPSGWGLELWGSTGLGHRPALLHGPACKALGFPSNNPLQDGGLGAPRLGTQSTDVVSFTRNLSTSQAVQHGVGTPPGLDNTGRVPGHALTWPLTSDVTCLGNSGRSPELRLTSCGVTNSAMSRQGCHLGHRGGASHQMGPDHLGTFPPTGPHPPPPSGGWGRGAFKSEVRETEASPSRRSIFLLTF